MKTVHALRGGKLHVECGRTLLWIRAYASEVWVSLSEWGDVTVGDTVRRCKECERRVNVSKVFTGVVNETED